MLRIGRVEEHNNEKIESRVTAMEGIVRPPPRSNCIGRMASEELRSSFFGVFLLRTTHFTFFSTEKGSGINRAEPTG